MWGHIAMYKVGDASGSDESVVLAGLDTAIKDGVDVVSLSMEGDESHFDQDPIAIGAFSAISKGIVVVCSTGNSGPKMGTVANEVANDAPWLLTVAAGSVDRSFGTSMRLGNGKRIDGEALNQVVKSDDAKFYPLLYSDKGRYCKYEDDHAKVSLVDALVVRSATRVSREVFEAARGRLRVVGRAGVGIDNVDLQAATEAGCLVVNAPTANTVAAAEHAVALLAAMARNVAQADASLKAGT
jgi:hypothetical protein